MNLNMSLTIKKNMGLAQVVEIKYQELRNRYQQAAMKRPSIEIDSDSADAIVVDLQMVLCDRVIDGNPELYVQYTDGKRRWVAMSDLTHSDWGVVHTYFRLGSISVEDFQIYIVLLNHKEKEQKQQQTDKEQAKKDKELKKKEKEQEKKDKELKKKEMEEKRRKESAERKKKKDAIEKKKKEKENAEKLKEEDAFCATLAERYKKALAQFNSMEPAEADDDDDDDDDDDIAVIEQIVASRHKPGSKEKQYLCKWHDSDHRTWEDASELGEMDAITDYYTNGEVTCKQWRTYVKFSKDPNIGDDWPNGEKVACPKCNHCTESPVICVECECLTCDNGECTVIVVACVCVAGARICSTPCVSAFTYLLIYNITHTIGSVLTTGGEQQGSN